MMFRTLRTTAEENITVGEVFTASEFVRFYLSTTCFVDSRDTEENRKRDHSDGLQENPD